MVSCFVYCLYLIRIYDGIFVDIFFWSTYRSYYTQIRGKVVSGVYTVHTFSYTGLNKQVLIQKWDFLILEGGMSGFWGSFHQIWANSSSWDSFKAYLG